MTLLSLNAGLYPRDDADSSKFRTRQTTTANQKKYFYSPHALLDHKSAVSTHNRVTKKPKMRFREGICGFFLLFQMEIQTQQQQTMENRKQPLCTTKERQSPKGS